MQKIPYFFFCATSNVVQLCITISNVVQICSVSNVTNAVLDIKKEINGNNVWEKRPPGQAQINCL